VFQTHGDDLANEANDILFAARPVIVNDRGWVTRGAHFDEAPIKFSGGRISASAEDIGIERHRR
jgi:hypothetical protein